jgi:hypothetical protein
MNDHYQAVSFSDWYPKHYPQLDKFKEGVYSVSGAIAC